MRTEEDLRNQPAVADGSGFAEGEDEQQSPYSRFFQALEELSLDKELYGPASIEVRMSQARAEEARRDAIVAWRSSQQAA